MARTHIHTISTTYTQWPTEFIVSRNTSPPTLRCLVRAQRDADTMFHHIPPLSLTNPIASTLRAHFTHQGNTLLASLRAKPPTSPTLTLTNKHTATSHPPNTHILPSPPQPPLAEQNHHMATSSPPRHQHLHPPLIMQVHIHNRGVHNFTLSPHPPPRRSPHPTPRHYSQPPTHHTPLHQ
jgi:hypothetical protein